MIVRIRNVAVCTFTAAVLLACDSAERQDAQVVLSAIHRYRSAPNDLLPSMVDALRSTPCKQPDSCQAKDECLAVGDATAKALRLKSEVERGLDALGRGTITREAADEQAFPTKLDEAAALLKKGHDGLPRCDDAVQALKRKYRI